MMHQRQFGVKLCLACGRGHIFIHVQLHNIQKKEKLSPQKPVVRLFPSLEFIVH